MAKQTLKLAFKDVQISFEKDTITKQEDGKTKIYVLSDFLKKLEGENKKVDISITEKSEIEPDEYEGE